MVSYILKNTLSIRYMLYHTLVNLHLTIHRPYVPGLLLGTGAGINSVRYNKVPDSTSYVNIMVSNTVIGSLV